MAEKKAFFFALLLGLALICAGCAPREAPAPTAEPAAEQTPVPEPVSVSAGGRQVIRREGEAYYPSEGEKRYHFVYAYPLVLGEDYAAAAVNDTYQMALDEMMHLMLPMLANEEEGPAEAMYEVRHDFFVTCNNDRVLSIVQRRSQRMGDEETLSLDPLVFDVSGEYTGEPLTLRGCILAGLSGEKAEDMTAEQYPQAAKILAGSSDLIAEAVAEQLYPAFLTMQQEGTARADVSREDFEWEFAPAASFYVNAEGNVVFFFPPALLTAPSFDVPVFPYTAAEIEALL